MFGQPSPVGGEARPGQTRPDEARPGKAKPGEARPGEPDIFTVLQPSTTASPVTPNTQHHSSKLSGSLLARRELCGAGVVVYCVAVVCGVWSNVNSFFS